MWKWTLNDQIYAVFGSAGNFNLLPQQLIIMESQRAETNFPSITIFRV